MHVRPNAIAVLILAGMGGAPALAGTSFTYQGELTDGGAPADGTYNMDFSLWDASSGGTRVGPANEFNDLVITEGRFAVELDYGGAAFNGADRWLEISVNGTELSPRHHVTDAPRSVQTRGIFVNDGETFVGIGRDAPITTAEYFGVNAPVSAGYGGMYISTDGANGSPFYGYSAGGDVDAYHFLDGTTGNWYLVNGGGARITVTNDGRIGIGTTTPDPLITMHVSSSEPVAVAGSTASTVGAGLLGEATATSGSGAGVVGASSSPTGFDFYAQGAGINYGSASSRRWKRNVESIGAPLEKISRLRGVYFDWDVAHGGHHDVGMIAEEVGAVLPEIVSYEANGGDARGMDYSKLTPLLVEAVNALRAEIAALRADNVVLHRQLELQQLASRETGTTP